MGRDEGTAFRGDGTRGHPSTPFRLAPPLPADGATLASGSVDVVTANNFEEVVLLWSVDTFEPREAKKGTSDAKSVFRTKGRAASVALPPIVKPGINRLPCTFSTPERWVRVLLKLEDHGTSEMVTSVLYFPLGTSPLHVSAALVAEAGGGTVPFRAELTLAPEQTGQTVELTVLRGTVAYKYAAAATAPEAGH